jgi:CheY-like chemotaxis protein
MSQKILVIDDTLAASKLAEGVLAQNFNGVDVLLAQRASEAFDRFNVVQPDLILLNEAMPDMDGEAICYRLLNDPATAKVPIALMASNGNGESIEERYSNVIRVLPKPLTPEAFLEVVTSALAKSKGPPPPSRNCFSTTPPGRFSAVTRPFSLSAPPCRWPTATSSRACCASSSTASRSSFSSPRGSSFCNDAQRAALLPRLPGDSLGDQSRHDRRRAGDAKCDRLPTVSLPVDAWWLPA